MNVLGSRERSPIAQRGVGESGQPLHLVWNHEINRLLADNFFRTIPDEIDDFGIAVRENTGGIYFPDPIAGRLNQRTNAFLVLLALPHLLLKLLVERRQFGCAFLDPLLELFSCLSQRLLRYRSAEKVVPHCP